MKGLFLRTLLVIMFISPFSTGPVGAQSEADEARIKAEQQALDNETRSGSAQAKVDRLAGQFQVSNDVVEELRNKTQGWGEITIRLPWPNNSQKPTQAPFPP